jgi:YggT family protein
MNGLASNMELGLLQVISVIFTILEFIIIAAALVSWVSPDPRNPIVQFLYRFTEPIFRPLRRILPPRLTGGLDFSPLLAILILIFVRALIFSMLGASFRMF